MVKREVISKGETWDGGMVNSRTNLVRDSKNSPFLKRTLEHPTTDLDTLIHLVKVSLGTGVLAMPFAFSNAGIWLGLIGTLFIGFICTHCVHIMVKSAHELCWRHSIPTLDFGDLAELALKHGPKPVRFLSGFARGFVKTLIVVTGIGGCSVYISFVSSNIGQVINSYTGTETDFKLYILGVSVVLMALGMIRNLRYLSPFSLLSNVLVFASIVIVFIYVFDGLPSVQDRESFGSVVRLPVFFSTAVFALEAITMIMPLENSMKTPENFVGCFRVLNTAMCMIVCMYALVGFFGYLKYGIDIKGSISLNLPQDEGLAQAAKLMLSIAIGLTFPLPLYCIIDLTWFPLRRALGQKLPFILHSDIGEYVYRALLVLLTTGCAIGIPNLGALMGLFGAVCLSTLGLMFPAVLETVVYWKDLGFLKWKLWKNLFILVFGVVGFATGIYTSINDIIASFGDQE